MKLLTKLHEQIGACGVLVNNGYNYKQTDAALATLDEIVSQMVQLKHSAISDSYQDAIDDILNMEVKE